MSKTKDKVIDAQNEAKPQGIADVLQADKNVTGKAAVVCGMMFLSTQTPPAVYVQGDDRVVVAAPTDGKAAELRDAVVSCLSDKFHTNALGAYGKPETTGKVWYDIDIKPKSK